MNCDGRRKICSEPIDPETQHCLSKVLEANEVCERLTGGRSRRA